MRLALIAPVVAALAVPLAGSWSTTISGAPSAQFDGVWKLRFSASGAYLISKGPQKLVSGKATFHGATVTFHDVSGPASCVGTQAVGSYAWTISGRALRFKPVKEPCAGRRFVLDRTFAHIESGPPA